MLWERPLSHSLSLSNSNQDLFVHAEANDMVEVWQRDGGLGGVGGHDHFHHSRGLALDAERLRLVLVGHFAVDGHHLPRERERIGIFIFI